MAAVLICSLCDALSFALDNLTLVRALQTPQREFLIRVSALEIYNEVVRDLLRPDSGPLRLLDDPERGTVVERLAEEVVRSSGHLYQILEDCEGQPGSAGSACKDLKLGIECSFLSTLS
jgi:hypothetical protein